VPLRHCITVEKETTRLLSGSFSTFIACTATITATVAAIAPTPAIHASAVGVPSPSRPFRSRSTRATTSTRGASASRSSKLRIQSRSSMFHLVARVHQLPQSPPRPKRLDLHHRPAPARQGRGLGHRLFFQIEQRHHQPVPRRKL